jgi:diguanylate cyclase (GGDEF)-like protein
MVEDDAVMSIRSKVLAAFFVVLGVVIALMVTAVRIELSIIETAASLEATHIAESIATVSRDGISNDTAELQKYIEQIGKKYGRDAVVVDQAKRGVADADIAEVGTYFTHDSHDEVAQTIKDGQTRIFEEKNTLHPEGIKQIVVPIRKVAGDANSSIVGAVILEYTPLYNSLIAAERTTLILMFSLGAATILLLFTVGFLLAAGIGRRLKALEIGVTLVARGGNQKKVSELPRDEIGKLGVAFNKMSSDLHFASEQLSKDQQLLEARVVERTAELADANLQLQEEMREKQLANERSEYLAYYDSLTALPNRRMFGTLLGRSIDHARRYNKELAVLFIDLDRFKNINDTLGHGAGDLMLSEVAHRLKSVLRESDTVARLGGDEFVILLPEVSSETDVATVAQHVLSAISKSIMLLGQEFRITASVGISLYPSGGEDEQTLMKNADVAMYRAKEEGKNNFKFYSENMNSHSFERLALESSLRLALERNEFTLHYQPKLAIGAHEITGMEALLRWEHPALGMVAPIKFIPIAEETGLIVPIGTWVLKTACRQNVAWQNSGMAHLCMAVNLSPRQFSDDNLLHDIATALEESGMDPTLLELEITEGMLMHDVEKAMKSLTALRDMGVRLAIDDFGTGYSSLSQLKRFPVNTIKVDRSFVRDLDTNADDRGITEAIIAMGKKLSLTVIAEGVETEGQLAFLRQHQCDEFQGFYFSKAVPADEFAELVRSQAIATDPGSEPRPKAA